MSDTTYTYAVAQIRALELSLLSAADIEQLVAIARAMVTNPQLLLADEPTGALDSASGRQILELFAQLHEAGATILMITHDASVASHAQTLYHIRDGVLTGEKEG